MRDLFTLGFGTANLGNLHREVSEDEAMLALETAWSVGIRYFDTAPHYGLGLSERRLGDFLRTKPRDEFVVSTKVGRLLRSNPAGNGGGLDITNGFAVPTTLRREWDFTSAGIRRSHEESLERLGLERVDILYLHDPDQYDLDAADETAYPALIALREQGLVNAVGVGSMSTEAINRATKASTLDILMIAGRLTLLEQPVLGSAIPAALANGTSVVAAGVYNSGLLATKMPTSNDRYDYGDVPAETLRRARRIAAVCAEHGVDLPTAAIQDPLRIPSVVNVVFGSADAAQIRDNLRRVSEPIPDDLWADLAEAGLIPS